MKSAKWLIVVVAGILLISIITIGAKQNNKCTGESLVKKLWSDMKDGDVESIEGYISPAFQSIHQDGARTGEQELELIKNLDLGDYTLTDINTTENESMIVVTYFVSVTETIDGEQLNSTPAPRMSAWQKTEDGWKWIIHANLKPLK